MTEDEFEDKIDEYGLIITRKGQHRDYPIEKTAKYYEKLYEWVVEYRRNKEGEYEEETNEPR